MKRQNVTAAVLVTALLVVLALAFSKRFNRDNRGGETGARSPTSATKLFEAGHSPELLPQKTSDAPPASTPSPAASASEEASGSPALAESDGELEESTESEALGLREFLDEHDQFRSREDGRDFLIAAFDVNDDKRPDLIVFEKKELEVSQVLLGGKKGELTEATSDVKVPEYLRRFLVLAAEEGPDEGLVSVRTDKGEDRDVLLLGKE